MRVKIKYIEKYGYLGRDFHPKDSDIGLEGSVCNIFVESNNSLYNFEISERDITALDNLLGKDNYIIFYKVKMDSGHTLELVDEEVEIL